MRLVEILARELEEWPEGQPWASQDPDKEVRFYSTRFDFYASELADDAGEDHGEGVQVTREMWEAERKRIETPAWNGNGLPPVGTVCEAWHDGSAQGVVEVRYAGDCMVLWNVKMKHEQCSVAENYSFRPIRTPEQIAAEEREKAIEEMVYGAAGCTRDGHNTKAFLICGFLYDAGYRKLPQ